MKTILYPAIYTMNNFIEVKNLSVQYSLGKKNIFGKEDFFNAVDGINLSIKKGSIVGLVGESGSGKSTLGKALLAAKEFNQGTIHYHFNDGMLDLSRLNKINLHQFRSKAQLIFQDPYNSLSPRMTVRDIIAEPIESLGLSKSKQDTNERVIEIAEKCQLNVSHLNRFPHAFSGGQRQRISIARSLIAQPEFIVADESVAALDVSIQAGILKLLKNLQTEMNLTILFISHDLSVISNFCDEVAVMYLGKIVEFAPKNKIFLESKHPYTKALLNAVPSINPNKKNVVKPLEGEIPSIYNRPNGCVFQTRCPKATQECYLSEPSLIKIHDHQFNCINSDD